MLENAARICEAKCGISQTWEGDDCKLLLRRNYGHSPDFIEEHAGSDVRTRTCRRRSMPSTKLVVQICPHYRWRQADPECDPCSVAAAELGGFRTILAVPMLQGEQTDW